MIYFGVKKWCQNSGQDVYGSSGIHKRSQSCLWNISPIVRKLFQNNGKTLFLVLCGLYPKAWDVTFAVQKYNFFSYLAKVSLQCGEIFLIS